MTTDAVPPPPPPPPPRHSWPYRVVRVVLIGLVAGPVVLIAVAWWITGSLGPPSAADVCSRVPAGALERSFAEVRLGEVCTAIDVRLDEPISGTDGFEGDFKYAGPPSDPARPRPAYLVWDSDGCSAPVLGRGPFDFTLACNRHDFGWRNLKGIHGADAPIWVVDNKDRVDAGFLYDMRLRCAALSAPLRIACETTARVYYTAVRLNPSGVQGAGWAE